MKHGLIAEIDFYNCMYSEEKRIWWLLDEDGSYADFFVEETVSSSSGEHRTTAYPVDCTTNIRTKISKAKLAERGLVYVGRVHGIPWDVYPCNFEIASASDLLNHSTRLIMCEESISKVSEVLNFGGLQFESLNDLNHRIRVLDEILDELHSIRYELTIQYFRSTCSRYIERADRIKNLFTNPGAILDSIKSILNQDFGIDVEDQNPQEAILNASDLVSLLRAIQLIMDLQKISESISSSDDEDEVELVDGMIESLRCLDILGVVSHKLMQSDIDELQSWAELDYNVVYDLIDDYGPEIIRTAHPERVGFIVDADFDAEEGRETGWRAKWFDLHECMIVVNRNEIIHQSDWEQVRDIRESYNTYHLEAESAHLYDMQEESEFSEEARKWLTERSERISKLGPYSRFLSGSNGGTGRVVGYSVIDTQMFPNGDEEKYTQCFYTEFEGELDVSDFIEI